MIKIAAALANVRELFLDTAPIIYHVEGNLAYQPLTDQVFQTIQAGTLSAVTLSITLSECLAHPYRRGDSERSAGCLDRLMIKIMTARRTLAVFPRALTRIISRIECCAAGCR